MVFVREPKMFTHTFMAEVGERNCNGAFSILIIYTSLPMMWFPLLWLEVRGGGRKETIWESKEETHQRDAQPHKIGGQIR